VAAALSPLSVLPEDAKISLAAAVPLKDHPRRALRHRQPTLCSLHCDLAPSSPPQAKKLLTESAEKRKSCK
jgi:hypothetical protein